MRDLAAPVVRFEGERSGVVVFVLFWEGEWGGARTERELRISEIGGSESRR